MANRSVRAHVVLPEGLVAEMDALVGQRRRSAFLTEAATNELARRRLLRAADAVRGSLAERDVPGWETSEAAEEWVRAMRRDGRDPWALALAGSDPGDVADR